MYHHQMLSQQAILVNHAMQQMNGRVESVLAQNMNQGEMRTKPSHCHVCTGDATYEAGVAISIVKVVGRAEWIQQWRSLTDIMRTLERKLRECIVAPPEELLGPRFTTCHRCIDPKDDDDDSDTDNDAPLQPFL